MQRKCAEVLAVAVVVEETQILRRKQEVTLVNLLLLTLEEQE